MRKIWALISSKQGRSVVAVIAWAIAGMGAVNLDHRTLQQRAQRWAAAHSSSAPTTLEALAAYPAEYRQAIFRTLPVTEQSRLWRAQLQRVLDTEPNLNDEQRAFLATTMALATPASFMKDMPHPEVCEDIARLFTNTAQRQKVRAIAVGVTPATTFGATWVNVSERVRSAVTVRAGGESCNCRGEGWCECGLIGYACVNGDCEHANTCGCIWGDGECNKVCQAAILMLKPIK